MGVGVGIGVGVVPPPIGPVFLVVVGIVMVIDYCLIASLLEGLLLPLSLLLEECSA